MLKVNVPKNRLKVALSCQVGKHLDLAKFAIDSAIANSGMIFREDFDICFICWKTSNEVYQWLEDNKFWYIVLDWEKETDQSFHHLLYNGWRAGYEQAYEFSDFHVPIATDHYFFHNWLINLYKHRTDLGIVSATLVERGHTFSLHPKCDLGITAEGEFDYDKAAQVFSMLFLDKRVEDKYNGRYHIDHGIDKDGNVRMDGMPFIISDLTYDLIGPMPDFNQYGTTGDTAMFDKCIDMDFPRYLSRSSISYHVGAVETNRNKGT